MKLIDVTGTLVIDNNVIDWCRYPYPGHPKGCPNWNKRSSCPPIVKHVSDSFDLSQQHWFAIIEFNIGEHSKRMKAINKGWSDRQAMCVLYWQKGMLFIYIKYSVLCPFILYSYYISAIN